MKTRLGSRKVVVLSFGCGCTVVPSRLWGFRDDRIRIAEKWTQK